MSKSYQSLMAAVDAAGYVFAAPDDAPAIQTKPHLEATFRNGHHQAALKASKAATRVVAETISNSRALTTAPAARPAYSWLNTTLALLRPRGIAA